MRRAPPLVIAVLPQPRLQVVCAGLACLAWAGLALTFWAWALLLLPLAARWGWQEAQVIERRLRWDGQAWWLTEPNQPEEIEVRVRVVLDGDDLLLVRVAPSDSRWARGRRYLPLSRSGQGPIWGALRATLFAARQA